jgi:DNA polymerase/3'-5' exonuclease PolX
MSIQKIFTSNINSKINSNINSKIIFYLEELKKIYKLDETKKWNLRALSKAIDEIKNYKKTITSGKELQKEIKGIGEKIALRIDEILNTGSLAELSNSELSNINITCDNKTSIEYIENLLLITGVGMTRAKKWLGLDIKTVEDVKKARDNKIITTTHHIDIGIKYYYDFLEKIPRFEIDIMKNILTHEILKIDKGLVFEICGSYRRGLKESGDIDILVSHPDFINEISKQNFLKKIVNYLKKCDFITDCLTDKGDTKFMGVCKIKESKYSRRIDIRVVDYECYFSALLYFTGSKNFNLFIRNKAIEQKLSLNEYSLTNLIDNKKIFLNSEKDIFDMLNIPYMSPEERN